MKGRYVIPGLIDGHIHIESSMLLPHNFGMAVIRWGTTTVVTDPHEIANVLGMDGIRLMQASAELGPIDVRIMVPSSVPATDMETSGAEITTKDIEKLLKENGVTGLAEMMHFPGVVSGQQNELDKIEAAYGKPIDGHSPGLTGKDLNAYIASGIMSDHECTTAQEAYEKLSAGMHIMIREGSTAKNLETLLPVVNEKNAMRFMLVTDDVHPDTLLTGHLNNSLKKAIKLGLDPITAIRMATLNPAVYFGLRNLGAVAPGYQADIVVLDDLVSFLPYRVYKKGELAAEKGKLVKDLPTENFPVMTSMNAVLTEKPFQIKARKDKARVIEVIPGQIITRKVINNIKLENGFVVSDPENDILKVAVIERHTGSGNISIGLVKGFNLTGGALASSVAHDSHNIIVVGANDTDMERAVIEVISMGGGLAVAEEGKIVASLALPVAGLMSDSNLEYVVNLIHELNDAAFRLGCKLGEPFMMMSFLSLPVVPELRITDKGLVDVNKFKFVPLFGED
jgi:adenine deaminase